MAPVKGELLLVSAERGFRPACCAGAWCFLSLAGAEDIPVAGDIFTCPPTSSPQSWVAFFQG